MGSTIDNIFNPQALSSIEYTDNLKEIVSDILKEQFPGEPTRQQIKVHSNRLQFCCPCCGDSLKDPSKKRGNIGLTGTWTNLYKCFNCGVSMPVSEFVRKYYRGSVPMSVINYMAEYKPGVQAGVDGSVNNSLEMYNQENIDLYSIPRETLKTFLDLQEVNDPINNWNKGCQYLLNRNQRDFTKFLYRPGNDTLFVLNLSKSGNIIGLQTRCLTNPLPKNEPKYRTYNLTNIYKLLLKDYLVLNVEIPQEIDTLSMLFNILLVNYSKPIIVTEGPMDAFLLTNAVALCGAAKTLPVVGNFKFMFDDDVPGREHAIEMLKSGHTVFLWNEFKKENNIPNADKWDVNDILNYYKKHNKGLPNFSKATYWSNDIFDAISI